MSEQYATQPHDALIAAFKDANMTQPNGGAALFDPSIFQIEIGDGQSINNSTGVVEFPLTKIYLFVGMSYGNEVAYTDDPTYRDGEIWIPFTVMAGTNGDQMDTLARLDFARKSRAAVFSAHGLTEVSEATRARRLAYSSKTGLVGVQYAWRFWWASSTTT